MVMNYPCPIYITLVTNNFCFFWRPLMQTLEAPSFTNNWQLSLLPPSPTIIIYSLTIPCSVITRVAQHLSATAINQFQLRHSSELKPASPSQITAFGSQRQSPPSLEKPMNTLLWTVISQNAHHSTLVPSKTISCYHHSSPACISTFIARTFYYLRTITLLTLQLLGLSTVLSYTNNT